MAVAVRKSRWRSICSDDDDVNVDDDKKKEATERENVKIHENYTRPRKTMMREWTLCWLDSDTKATFRMILPLLCRRVSTNSSRVYYQRDDDEKIVINSDGKSS